MGTHITKRNTTSENIIYLVDNKKPCQHKKLHLLTARREKWISEKYIEMLKIIQHDSHKYITGNRQFINS